MTREKLEEGYDLFEHLNSCKRNLEQAQEMLRGEIYQLMVHNGCGDKFTIQDKEIAQEIIDKGIIHLKAEYSKLEKEFENFK